MNPVNTHACAGMRERPASRPVGADPDDPLDGCAVRARPRELIADPQALAAAGRGWTVHVPSDPAAGVADVVAASCIVARAGCRPVPGIDVTALRARRTAERIVRELSECAGATSILLQSAGQAAACFTAQSLRNAIGSGVFLRHGLRGMALCAGPMPSGDAQIDHRCAELASVARMARALGHDVTVSFNPHWDPGPFARAAVQLHRADEPVPVIAAIQLPENARWTLPARVRLAITLGRYAGIGCGLQIGGARSVRQATAWISQMRLINTTTPDRGRLAALH